mgnify:CR=1 FL=1
MIHQTVIFIRRYANKVLNIPMPSLISGEGELKSCPKLLKQVKSEKVFIVTDKILTSLGITQQLIDILEKEQFNYQVFDQVTPDPTVSTIEQGVEDFKENNCDSIIALGGGSVMDCAKAIAACVVKNKKISALAGMFRVRKALPPFIAIPTTAGTGSEATLVAVITDPVKKQKFTVVDPCLVPQFAIIDPLLMVGLPAKITAETGIDALTHAIESYLSVHATAQTKPYSLDAIKRIFINLPLAYNNGEDLKARTEMAMASYYAGVAFTRASIGYVHAIAHQLGGYYHIPHGLANAVLLPHVLEFSFDKACKQYAEMAYAANLISKDESIIVAAQAFVQAVKDLNLTLNIQSSFAELQSNDIPLLANRAVKEAFCDYPVPKQMTVKECESILEVVIEV